MSGDVGDWLIYIVGSGSIQNELLAGFLEKETGVTCRVEKGDGLFPKKVAPHRRSIVFGDCYGRSGDLIIEQLQETENFVNDDFHVVLFNVCSSLNIEEELLRLGVWGVFYAEDSSLNLPRGVEAIRNGEIWVSRQKMSSCLVNMRRRENGGRLERHLLSVREREVLQMIADGLTNDAIADKLCISIHTVRSHGYRIFKKIEVSNRQQASLWALRHL
ncbi:MAG: response regulator transcription factor [Deltaproteobacteria bacterium]|nr:response regulator transcription factor [Deltaproteobacteria bacterium]